MERKTRSTVVSIRIPDGLLERIEDDVENSGDFSSRADYIQQAIRYFEEHRAKVLAERKLAYRAEDDYIPTSENGFSIRDDEANS